MISDRTSINLLLQKSQRLFTYRKLDKALKLTQQALDLSREVDYPTGLIQANLLLGWIEMTKGRYQGNAKNYPKALEYVEAAKALSDSTGNEKQIEILLAFNNVYQNQQDFDTAENFCQKALDKSNKEEDLKNKILCWCAISNLSIRQNKFEDALEYAQKARHELKQNKALASDKMLVAEIYNQLGQVYIKRQEYGKILDYGQTVLELSRALGDIEKEITSLNNIAIFYGVKSDYKTAMQYFLEALDKSKAVDFRQNIAQCLINIATIYAHLFNFQEAILRYKTMLEEYEDVLMTNTKIIVYNNLGNIHYQLDEQEQAEFYFEKALSLSKENSYKEMIAHSLAQLSRTNVARKDLGKASENANQAQELIQNLGEVNGKQINFINLGNIEYHLDNLDEAIKLTSRGIAAAKRMGDEATEIQGYQLLANIYRKAKKFEKALDYQMVYSKAQENFSKEQRNRYIIDLEIKNAIKEKQTEIEQLTKENEYQSLLLNQSDQIAKQNAQLIAANEELRQFAYVASHDLKEPLRMIGSYTQLIYRMHGADFNEDSKIYFDFVKEGAERMNNLLDALLRYATIGKTDEDLDEVKIKDVVDIAKINLRVRIEESNATIHSENLPIVFSSQSLLIQLFQNLISNALKFQKPDVAPEIFITGKKIKEEYIIRVKDNGIGIKPEYKDRIFVIFQRLHNRTKYEGTGIGLAICYKIMQRLDGRIWVEPNETGGATFCIVIPIKKNIID